MTFEKIQESIVETLNCEKEKITMDANLRDDLGADSLDATELAMTLETEFDITIDEEDLVNFKTVADIVNYIDNK